MKRKRFLVFVVLVGIILPITLIASSGTHTVKVDFPPALSSYNDGHLTNIGAILLHRIQQEPLNLLVTLFFFGAIIHTFMAGKFQKIAHHLQEKHDENLKRKKQDVQYSGDVIEEVSFLSQLFHFFGDIEVVFGLWVLPVFWSIAYFYDLHASISYFSSINYTEPMFVVVIMTLAAARPIARLAEQSLKTVSKIGRGSPASLWFTILTVGPLLGSFITEPAAMTISALILAKEFYARGPSNRFAYATIGLLFVNISVGGTLTHFAAPPVLMIAGKWNWDLAFMFFSFGWKAILGILIANTIYFLIFRREFAQLKDLKESKGSNLLIKWDMREDNVPASVTLVHVLFLIWTVYFAHYPPLFIAGFLCFLGFVDATGHHQNRTNLKPALLVGFFLSGLVIHGGLQKWWIAPILGSLSEIPLMLGSTILTAFNDNAAITYLSSLVPNLSDSMKYAVVAGAVTGGGLTVIANAPNPAGLSILQKFFPKGFSPLGLLLGALIPTIIMGCAFMML
ncbi:putative Na+/H+ antiporter [bacterium]|nr:putative Na+/H+ antiporter [bacterium]